MIKTYLTRAERRAIIARCLVYGLSCADIKHSIKVREQRARDDAEHRYGW
jgi:hypothetical protein